MLGMPAPLVLLHQTCTIGSKSKYELRDDWSPSNTAVHWDVSRNAEPEWTEGDPLVESVYRFNGQSAPAIVLSEVDFVELSHLERRKLFVGMTRAQMAIGVVMSRGAEAIFSGLVAG